MGNILVNRIGNPLISVLIPYYNDKDYLSESIDSVLKQSYENFELILINHASTDGSRSIAHSFKDDRIIHVDIEKNQGAGGGLIVEKFMEYATGEYVKLFCADDIMRENCLRTLTDYLINHPQIDFAFGNVEYIDKESSDLNENFFDNREGFSIKNDEWQILDDMFNKGLSYLPYIGSIIRTFAFENVRFDRSLIYMFDMSMWAQMLVAGRKIGFLNELVADYRIHEGQVSALTQYNKALNCSRFETFAFRVNCFAYSSNVELIKYICRSGNYADALTYCEDVPFVIFEYLYNKDKDEISYLKLHDLLEEDEPRRRLLDRFNFDVCDFRKMIIKENTEKKEKDDAYTWKERIYNIPAVDESLCGLLYLIARRVFYYLKELFHLNSNRQPILKEDKYTI